MQEEPKQKTSNFLSLEQNQLVFSLLGPKSKSRAIGIVRAHRSKPPTHNEWQVWCCGVASFTKDQARKSYYIQIFDIEKRVKMFEYPVNQDLKYRADCSILHQFDAETFVIGLEFAIEEEALKFKVVLEKRLKKMGQKDSEFANLPRPFPSTTEKSDLTPEDAFSPASPSFRSPNPPIKNKIQDTDKHPLPGSKKPGTLLKTNYTYPNGPQSPQSPVVASHRHIPSKPPPPTWKKSDISLKSPLHPVTPPINKANRASAESEGNLSNPYLPVPMKPNLRLGPSDGTSLMKTPSQSFGTSTPTLPNATSKPAITKAAQPPQVTTLLKQPIPAPPKLKQKPLGNDRHSGNAPSRNFLLDQIKNPPQKLRHQVNLQKTLNSNKQNNGFVASSGAHPIFKDLSKVLDARGKACRGMSLSDVSASSSESDDDW